MKRKFLLVGLISIFVFASCNENKREENTTVPPAEAPAPPAPPAPLTPETVRIDKTKPDGTTIKVDESGVKYENQEGGKKSKVNVSKDSASIEITRPK